MLNPFFEGTENHKHTPDIGEVVTRQHRVSGQTERVSDSGSVTDDFGNACHDLFSAFEACAVGELGVHYQIPFILFRYETDWNRTESDIRQPEKSGVDEQDNRTDAEKTLDCLSIRVRGAVKKPVKSIKETREQTIDQCAEQPADEATYGQDPQAQPPDGQRTAGVGGVRGLFAVTPRRQRYPEPRRHDRCNKQIDEESDKERDSRPWQGFSLLRAVMSAVRLQDQGCERRRQG